MGDRRFEGRTALVTGGGRGIGRAVALALASEGAVVAVASRTREQVDSVAAEVVANGGRSLAVSCDVSNATQVDHLVEVVRADLDAIDILVNCAGIFDLGPAEEFPVARARALLDTNIIGTLLVSQRVGREMIERGYGKIINFCSLLSFTAFPGRSVYAASKGGVLQLTRVLALEWARHRVNVNAVAPGMIEIETPHPQETENRLWIDDVVARIPAGRRGTPRDVTGPVLFLASDAAEYVHGQALAVDGGWLVNGYL